MVSLQPHFTSLLKSLPPSPVDQAKLEDLVKQSLAGTNDRVSSENRKLQWEYLLKNDIFELAMTEGVALKKDDTKYYQDLCGKLDLALAFTEHDACEPVFPFTILQDLLETQTIASCSHIFSWIESRADRLTEGMVPQKGKALILLRTLNDLLRRLSKMGTTTIFCGRILTFLSGVFPLGERSGVNLRGEYGPTWEGVKIPKYEEAEKVEDGKAGKPVADDEKMQVDEKKAVNQTVEKKEDFYNTFWSLQLPFSKPPIFANKDMFTQFRDAVNRVMPVIKEATAKERAMMGSRGGPGVYGAASLKRKREPEEASNSNEYFFAKFLTSPDLLDLEVADTHFRRQFLFQLLILLNHLLNFTATSKATWTTPRNRSLHMDFTLEDADAQWVQESLNKVFEELRQTTPNGRVFADTVHAILEREKNWVKWKNELCTPFDKEPWVEVVDGRSVGLFESTEEIRRSMRLPPEEWKWKLGTEPLTEIWEMGYKSLSDLQNPFEPGDVKDFVKKIRQEDARIGLRKKYLERMALAKARQAAPAAAAIPPLVPPPPALVVTSDISVDPPLPRPEDASGTLVAPRPVPASSTSPLHPSLPPKPSSPSKPASSSQEPVGTATATPVSGSAVAPAPVPIGTPVPGAPTSVQIPADAEILKFEENKQRWAWLALRAARDQYLQHFGKIGTGDIEALAQEIEKEKDKSLKGEDGAGGLIAEEHGSGSPSILATESSESVPKDVEMDS